MDKLGCKLLLVFRGEHFHSLVSIGDVQRAIIKGKEMTTPVGEILRKNIRMGKFSDPKEFLHAEMKKFRMEFMPIVDAQGQLADVVFWEDIFIDLDIESLTTLDVPVVIMAGGRGVRLKPITNVIPKALIPLGDKPIIEHIVDRFARKGVKNFHISVNYKKELIQQYFQEIPNRLYSVSYFEESSPLGTAGSLHLLKEALNQTFIVTNCDILIDDDYPSILEYHKSNRNELTVVASIKNYSIPYGILEVGNESLLKSIREKPELSFFINAGMYILEPHLLKEVPVNKFYNITELISSMLESGRRVGVYPVSDGSWVDVGDWTEYNKASRRLGFGEIGG
ncbi:MAG: nucleotidyltransferase family protein [Cyclobacteriaceae bacterium]|nr:nucleotidyltransferase family protein [Cyclobacteriaceae bacterium]